MKKDIMRLFYFADDFLKAFEEERKKKQIEDEPLQENRQESQV